MMQTLALNWGNFGLGLLIVCFMVVSVLLILAVLIQKPQGGGLAGAFGSGAGSGQTAFGAKTGDALTWFTVSVFALFLVTAIGTNLAARPATAETGAPAARGTEPAAPTTGGAGAPVTPAAPAQPGPEAAPTAVPPAPAAEEPAAEEPGAGEAPAGEPSPETPGR